MSRATETRLSKLEVRAGVAGRRVFIFGEVEPAKRELIACGEATGDDLFILLAFRIETRSPMCASPSTHRASGCDSSCPTCDLRDRRAAAWDRPGLLAAQ